jgi:Zn-dependent peptidase ImmA (M78 family)
MNKLLIQLEQLALAFRRSNGLSETESIRLKSLLQKNKIQTVFLPLSDSFSGMAVKMGKADDVKRFILINSNQTLGRQHFTICHELYHLYVQDDFKSETSKVGFFNKQDMVEYKADVFASCFLLPTNGVIQMIPEEELGKNKISLKTVLEIEHYFSCSRSALLHRLLSLGVIDKTLYADFNADKIKNAMQYGYTKSLYSPANEGVVIGDYGNMAKALFDKGMVSESAYFTLLEDIGVDLSNLDV